MSETLPKPKASTQDHLDIEDIVDDLVILKTGWIAMVMSTSAVNFDLLSEAEQDATIYAYGAFLNSLTFPIEILIRSKKADISAYFKNLEEAERVQPNPDLKRQIQKYEDFIQATVQQRTVLDKKFYIVITYSPAEKGLGIIGIKATGAKGKAQILDAAKASFSPKKDHVTKQLARLGLSARQLTGQELVELFYDIYNPAPTGTQRVLLDSASYKTPIVEPAIENPAPAKILNRGATTVLGGAEPGLMPQAQVPVGQQKTVVEVGLRPVPPRSGETERSEESGGQKAGESTGQKPIDTAAASPQSAVQTEALKGLQEAVAAASKLTGGTTSVPAGGGLDLRDNSELPSDTNPDDRGSGGVKI